MYSSGSSPEINDYYGSINVPTVAEQELHLQQLVQQGVISPEDAKTISQGSSAYNGIKGDDSLRSDQKNVLAGLQDIIDSGGMTMSDKANLSKIATDEDTASKGKREAILQNAEQRGMGGSGMQYMDQLLNEQNSATRKSQRDLDVAGQAQNRALQALMQQGTAASNLRTQDFGEQAKVADANDSISRFNAQNSQNVLNTNVANRNAAQQGNLALKQNLSNANAATNNQQQQYNKELLQKQFNNQMAKAGGQTGTATTNANNDFRDSQASADAYNKGQDKMFSIGSAIALSDERAKKDVEEFSPSDFLDSLTSYKYKYKDPKKHGDGEHVGVMAQDLEKTDTGSQMVSEGPDGKMIDYAKAGPSVLASLADINDRLRALEGEG